MRFDRLLWRCLAPGSYERTEKTITAVLEPRPGETVMAGVLLKMPPGWHTYWKNPGDSGAPTKIGMANRRHVASSPSGTLLACS